MDPGPIAAELAYLLTRRCLTHTVKASVGEEPGSQGDRRRAGVVQYVYGRSRSRRGCLVRHNLGSGCLVSSRFQTRGPTTPTRSPRTGRRGSPPRSRRGVWGRATRSPATYTTARPTWRRYLRRSSSGAVPVNANYGYTAAELTALLADADAAALVFSGELGANVAHAAEHLPTLRVLVRAGQASTAAPTNGIAEFEEVLASHSPRARHRPPRQRSDVHVHRRHHR